ncbi:MAG: Tad domain-containing protein [Bdellovibrionales bacterium]|nr:Tad domain-containing protein [Bdellovibrionales bacterium]
MPSSKHPRQRGQILILMAMLSTTLIVLFGMVVSIGHLVQAKINLQNAVDLAAMTGASWQARYLNHMALVNYRMRQNYKFTLYDLYVTQSRFNMGFRQEVAGRYSSGMDPFSRIPKSRWVFGICQQMEGYMPQAAIGETGEGTAQGTDMCQNVDDSKNYIPPIVPSPVVGTNPFLIAANNAIKALSERAKNVCRGSSGQNDAYFAYIMSSLESRQRFQMQQMEKVLEGFSQAFAANGDDVTGAGGEATSSIYHTFYTNLISANGGAQIRYINPVETRSVNANFTSLFNEMFASRVRPTQEFTKYFEVLESFFRIYVTNIGIDGAGGCQFSVAQKTYPSGSSSQLGTFLGITRSRSLSDPTRPRTPFNIVLRAEVKPRLLFWPESLTPTLVAVSAAKPFGSRIGPPKDQSDYEVSGGASLKLGGQNSYPLANMAFYPGDIDVNDGNYSGVGHRKILGFLYNALPNPRKGVNFDRPSVVNPPNQNCLGGDPSFVCLALSPTLYEGLFWSVFPFPASQSSGAPGRDVIFNLFPSDVSLTTANDLYAMPDRMGTGSAGSLNDLWHHTSDKLGDNRIFQANDGSPLFFSNRKTSLSSWTPSPTEEAPGRFGYQIKLASLAEICDDISTGGGVPLSDALSGYCGGNSTYNKVTH